MLGHRIRCISSSVAAFACCASVMMPIVAQSATEDGDFAARGIGASTCGVVVEALKGPQHDAVSVQLASWISGYLSHANRETDGVYDVMPIQDAFGVATVVARICEKNPETVVEPILVSVIRYLEEAEQDSVSDIIALERNGQSATVRASVLQVLYDRLIEKGFLDQSYQSEGLDDRAIEAFLAFQRSTGLQETGLPDSITIFLILSE